MRRYRQPDEEYEANMRRYRQPAEEEYDANYMSSPPQSPYLHNNNSSSTNFESHRLQPMMPLLRPSPQAHLASSQNNRYSWGSSSYTLTGGQSPGMQTPGMQTPGQSRSATPTPLGAQVVQDRFAPQSPHHANDPYAQSDPYQRTPPQYQSSYHQNDPYHQDRNSWQQQGLGPYQSQNNGSYSQVGPFESPFDSRPPSVVQQSFVTLTGDQLTLGRKDDLEGYSIERLNKRDDSETWKGWKRWVFKLVPVLMLANTGLYLLYLGLRMACLILAQRVRNTSYPQAWVFVAVEIATAVPSLAHNMWTMMSMKKRRRPQLRVVGNDVPCVDVFITCCREDDGLVMDTVRGACDLDYPKDRYRVIVLDDGRSETLQAAVNALGNLHPNLFYMAREKVPGKPHHFKAGNLNYGVDEVQRLPGGASPFIAALDADMIPEKHWLRAVMPHLLDDPKMALACPPQLFYNTPPSDPLAQSLDFFVHVIEPIKDTLGVAWCTGSGYVLRREALEEIGNFPLGSLAEDVATSSLMLGRGWKTAYVHEPLQFGTVPEDFGSHLKQRTRWAIGTVDTSFKLNFCLWGEKVRHMTFAQRFSGFLYAALSVYTILLTLSLFAIPIILVMEKPLVAYATDEQLRWLIRACFASTIANRLCEFALFIPAGYHTGQRGSRYQLWMSPYIAISIVRAFMLPKWLGGKVQAFKPTGSIASALNERDPQLKRNMFRRLWAILFNYMGIFHFGFVYLTLVAVVLTSYRCFYVEVGLKDLFICLITHAFWPPLTFLFIVTSLWTPIGYAIDPPQMPDREQLLDRDPKTDVAHPTQKSKRIAFGGQAAWFELEYTVATLYTCLIFVASFLF